MLGSKKIIKGHLGIHEVFRPEITLEPVGADHHQVQLLFGFSASLKDLHFLGELPGARRQLYLDTTSTIS